MHTKSSSASSSSPLPSIDLATLDLAWGGDEEGGDYDYGGDGEDPWSDEDPSIWDGTTDGDYDAPLGSGSFEGDGFEPQQEDPNHNAGFEGDGFDLGDGVQLQDWMDGSFPQDDGGGPALASDDESLSTQLTQTTSSIKDIRRN